ncbi:hypothetical protein UFOVP28_7 [uncultured Caudovirales phage]|uniref:DUF5808 domain-containing protein n=1 Tax=uncultured Caudovirales phage TaxID=2100421 RepID=A0A6J5KK02_9CAUD|nr:hypothetical protein UFOVP28_7 [uncultured Caudovirales phage]
MNHPDYELDHRADPRFTRGMGLAPYEVLELTPRGSPLSTALGWGVNLILVGMGLWLLSKLGGN